MKGQVRVCRLVHPRLLDHNEEKFGLGSGLDKIKQGLEYQAVPVKSLLKHLDYAVTICI